MISAEVMWNEEVEEILSDKLPVPVICQLRCVCKRWSSWRGGGQIEKPYLVFSFLDNERASAATYSPTLRRWYRLPLCNLRPSLPFWMPRGDVYLVAADGGLLCYMIGFASPQKDVNFIIVNPIANLWRQLPSLVAKPPLVCGMHVDKTRGVYKLILAGESLTFNEEEARATHLFDSATDQWKSGGDLPQEVFGVQKQCHFWDGSFHYVDCCANRVQAYDECTGIWKKVLPVIPLFLCSPTLVEYYGNNIALVGPIGKAVKLEIMVLDSCRREWKRMETLSSEPGIEAFLHRLVPGPHHSSLLCVGRMNVIYVLSSEADVILVYDAVQRRWSFVPSIPALRHNILEMDHGPSLLREACHPFSSTKTTVSLLQNLIKQNVKPKLEIVKISNEVKLSAPEFMQVCFIMDLFFVCKVYAQHTCRCATWEFEAYLESNFRARTRISRVPACSKKTLLKN